MVSSVRWKALYFTNLFLLPTTSKALRNFLFKNLFLQRQVKVGLEATGHYSYNILGFLLSKELATFVLNPLQTSQFRKSLTLRKTKTDKVDAKTIAAILASNLDLTPYTHAAFQNEELNSLTRYCFEKVRQRSKLR